MMTMVVAGALALFAPVATDARMAPVGAEIRIGEAAGLLELSNVGSGRDEDVLGGRAGGAGGRGLQNTFILSGAQFQTSGGGDGVFTVTSGGETQTATITDGIVTVEEDPAPSLPADVDGDEGDEGTATRLSPPSSTGTGQCGDPLVKAMVALDNDKRGQAGVGRLTCDNTLGGIAYRWSIGQCQDREISHDGFSGRCSESQLTTCGENVAFNRPPQLTTTVGNTHISWMDSPGHRDNILNSRFNVVGYGWYVCEANDSVYWTGFFAAR